MSDTQDHCLYCECESDQVPLISLRFRGKNLSICPEHLPLLIHDPARLAGKLPGAEDMTPADAGG